MPSLTGRGRDPGQSGGQRAAGGRVGATRRGRRVTKRSSKMDRGEVDQFKMQGVHPDEHYVKRERSTPLQRQRAPSSREQLCALKDKIIQKDDFGKKTSASVSCTNLQAPSSSHEDEAENAPMAWNGLSSVYYGAQGLCKTLSISTSECNVVDSISDTEDDFALPKSSSAMGVAMCMKKVYGSDCDNEDEVSTWSSILEEANRLECLPENTGNSLSYFAKNEPRRSWKGDRCKAKPKFSIRFQSHKKELYFHDVVEDENKEPTMAEVGPSVQDIQHRIPAHSMAELLEELQQENKKSPESAHSMAEILEEPQEDNKNSPESADLSAKVLSMGNKTARYSVSTLLEDLEKNSTLKWPSKLMRRNKTKERKTQLIVRRTAYHLGDTSVNEEDALELVGSRTSSEDEDNDKNQLILATNNTKGQTMADLLQEVFSASTVDVEELPLATRAGIGYYGRLQQIMQRDKDRHMEFLKQLHSNEPRGINVKILSRLLDAKLTVCHCLFGDDTMISQTRNSPKNCGENGETTERTVIFSSKICKNVDLEVGNVICIYPPWKEVQTTEDVIILCTYFSQMM
uniref:Mitogen-activated protein kinase 12 n=1 Tax=Anthurium amnicola TaxID=1678845 RepID=A0A1D1YFA1_9ARAE